MGDIVGVRHKPPLFRAGWKEGMANAADIVQSYLDLGVAVYPESATDLKCVIDGIRSGLTLIETDEIGRTD